MIKNILYNKLLGLLIKKGNKIKAKKILNFALSLASKKSGYSYSFLLLNIFSKLNTFVESKTVHFKRRIFIVPFPISLKRRSYLTVKWLLEAALQNNKKIPIYVKISEEILSLLKCSTSKAFKMKQLNDSQSILNKSNIHYRW